METTDGNGKVISKFNETLLQVEKIVAVVLAVVIVFIVAVVLLRILLDTYNLIFLDFFAGQNNTFEIYTDIFGKIINLLITIEFMTSIVKVLKTHEVGVLVLDVALITGLAICRKLIIFDYDKDNGNLLMGMSLLLVALGLFYFLVKFNGSKKMPDNDNKVV